MIKSCIFTLLVMGTVALTFAQNVTTYPYKEFNGKHLELDVYQPLNESDKPAPVIVLFHGGGFVGGSKEQMKEQCRFFSKRGFVTVSANYHLLQKGVAILQNDVVQSIKDAKTAVRWIKQNSKKLNVDSTMVLIGGGSAGGFLATQVALNPNINEESDKLEISTRAIALILYNPAFTPIKTYGPDVLTLISKTTPPVILFYGTDDRFKLGGEAFFKVVEKSKIPTQLWLAQGEDHGFFNKLGWNYSTNEKAINFLRKLGLASGKQEQQASDFPLTNYISVGER